LLIAAALDKKDFALLYQTAKENGLDVLSEVHSMPELEMVLECGADIIGINCRDLKTFKTDLELTKRMLRDIPNDKIKIAESGLSNHQELVDFGQLGANAFLIGETLMRADSPGNKLRELREG
jgi:indole-3-glycerol phosphate synthase